MDTEKMKPIEIRICMGSSCYARGNGTNLEIIENYLNVHGLEATVDLVGSRCEGCCADGPNLTVNGRLFGRVDREMLLDILREVCPAPEVEHE